MFKNKIKNKCFLVLLLMAFSILIKNYISEIYTDAILAIGLILLIKCSQVQLHRINIDKKIKTRNFLISNLAILPSLIISILYYNNIDLIIHNRSAMTKQEMFYTSIIFFLLWLILFLRIIYRHYINKQEKF